GKGSVFKGYLPRHEAALAPAPMESGPPAKGGNENILVIDDDESIARLMQRTLTRSGYRVEARTSGVEALEYFLENPSKVDLVITDNLMPQMTGEAMARELLKVRPDLPIILMTSFSKTATPEMARAIGIYDVILKPLDPGELTAMVRLALDKAMGKLSLARPIGSHQ
ncbi:MAG: response regulator, partial [Nitrospinae bacterium]|nr:response regulator [Nitrospinota bacterium]